MRCRAWARSQRRVTKTRQAPEASKAPDVTADPAGPNEHSQELRTLSEPLNRTTSRPTAQVGALPCSTHYPDEDTWEQLAPGGTDSTAHINRSLGSGAGAVWWHLRHRWFRNLEGTSPNGAQATFWMTRPHPSGCATECRLLAPKDS